MLDRHTMADRYRHILSPEDRARLPLYSALCDALAESDVALDILRTAAERHQNPTLILAILHYVALRGHPTLAPLYDDVRQGREVEVEHFVSTVLAALHAEPELVRRELHRSTQTNEPNRSAVLARVIGDVAASEGWMHINLIDVGCSMGLNLYPDFVRIADRDDGEPSTLVSECRTPGYQPSRVPVIEQRIGIDANPLDPRRSDDVLWLEACIWPEESRRFERFAAIVAQAQTWPEPERIQGDAVDTLDHVLFGVSGPTVVVNSWILAYLRPEERSRYREMLDRHFATRDDLAWIAFEHPSLNEALGFDAARPPVDYFGSTAVTVTTSNRPSTHWGWCHPHGHWFSVASGPKA